MAKRVSLPAADDLFRPTQQEQEADAAAKAKRKPGQSSGRVKHDEKMTVYVTAEELLAIEQARLTLRSTHSLAVDRGRLVRQAVAIALQDLADHGEDSQLVKKLGER